MKKSADPQLVGIRRTLYPMMYTVADRDISEYSIQMKAVRINVDARRIAEQT